MRFIVAYLDGAGLSEVMLPAPEIVTVPVTVFNTMRSALMVMAGVPVEVRTQASLH
jgi:hypothetical protein